MGSFQFLPKRKNDMPEVIVPVVFFASLFGVIYIHLTTRHRERMSLIEKGADPSLFQRAKQIPSYTLRFGLLCVGISLGVILGNILKEALPNFEEGAAIVSMIFLFGGISLIVSYFLEKKLEGGNPKEGGKG
jgi:hypothetical protein